MARTERLAIRLHDLRPQLETLTGRRSHARPECCLRLSRLSATPPLAPSVGARTRDRPRALLRPL